MIYCRVSACLAAILLLSLTSTVTSLSTLSYTFNATTSSPIKLPAYPLGIIQQNKTLQVDIGIWNTLTDLNNVHLNLLESQGMTQVTSITCTALMTCKLVYPITITQGYYIQVLPSTMPQTFSEPFYLIAKTYPGNITYSGNPAQQVLLKLGDVLRMTYIGKYFYVASASIITLSMYPLPSQTEAQAAFGLVKATGPTFTFDITHPVTITKVSFLNSIQTYKATVDPGFYILGVAYTTSTPYLTITWQSDAYACPHDPSYVDYYSLAQGCSFSQAQQGLPCISFNTARQICLECINGYTLDLITGICKANTVCPDRKYYHFGTCFDVSPFCDNYDIFTGNCLNCKNPEGFTLKDGVCGAKQVICGSRQFVQNYTCIDVSDKCNTYDLKSGKCLTCLNETYQLTNEGVCVLIIISCPEGQYAVGLSCVTIPVECINFDKVQGTCLNCIQGFYVENGACKRVICPAGQFPSKFGIFCINASPLCETYDPLNGNCLKCKNVNEIVRADGTCGQVSSPLAGCKQRQSLGFGPCLNAEVNCKAYNLVTGNCDECNVGFNLDYTGHCSKQPICGVSEWSSNGECIGVPENCLQSNELGLCSLCVNSNYRLENGQCVYFKSCLSTQFLNAAGQCVDVDSSCEIFNPSNGQCVTCKNSNSQPNLGVCCSDGQIYNGIACVDANQQQKANQNQTGQSCLLHHPSLGQCLKCNEGYSTDPVTMTGCIPNY